MTVAVEPYKILIGCSHGVYALYGSVIPHYVTHFKLLSRPFVYFIYFTFAIQISLDILNYFYNYNEMIAYEAHVTGLISGIISGFAVFDHRYMKTKTISVLTLIVTSIMSGTYYVVNWYPKPLFGIYEDKLSNICN